MADIDDRIDSPNDAYSQMAETWELLEDLKGGTKAMRSAGQKWLPMEPKEKYESYQVRISRSFLFEAYKDTVGKVVAKPFSRPVNVNGELPEILQGIQWNVDKAGRDLTQFCRDAFESAWTYGLTHAVYDFPSTERSTTLEDVRGGMRPVFIHVSPTRVIGWHSDVINGEQVLTQVRIKTIRKRRSGRFGTENVEEIKVWEPDHWEIWVKSREDEQFVLESEGPHTFGRVPVVTLYLRRTAFMVAEPPLEGLAWKNVEHWQKSSDHNNILRFARVPMRWASGVTDEDVGRMAAVGAGMLAWSENPDARMTVVEHSGAAIGSSQTDIQHVEQQMEVMGLQPFFRRSADATATGRMIDKENQGSDIQASIRATELFAESLYLEAARITNTELPDDFAVDIFNEFGLSDRDAKELDQLFQWQVGGLITARTFLQEAKRRGRLSDELDVDDELEEVGQESFPLPQNGALQGIDNEV